MYDSVNHEYVYVGIHFFVAASVIPILFGILVRDADFVFPFL